MATDYDAPRKSEDDSESIEALKERVPSNQSGAGDVEGKRDVLQRLVETDESRHHPVTVERTVDCHLVGTTCPGKAIRGRTAPIRATYSCPRAAKLGGGVPRKNRECRKPSSIAAC